MDIDIDEFQYDALQEIGNIGIGNATTALSQLIGKRVMVSSPSLMVVDTQRINENTSNVEIVGTVVRIVGDISGGNLIAFQKNTAESFVDILLQDTPYKSDKEMRKSVLNEAANILAGSYFNALSKFLDMAVLPSLPSQMQGSSTEIFEMVENQLNCRIDHVLSLTTMFEVETVSANKTVDGDMFLLLDSKSLKTILERIDRMRTI